MKLSWQNELQTAFTKPSQLEDFFQQSFTTYDYPIFIPQDLAAKIKKQGLTGPLAKQFLPQEEEAQTGQGLKDPIGDHQHSPTSRLVHRYHNRALLFPTDHCPVQCRYCFRKNELHQNDPLFQGIKRPIGDYLMAHPEIDEIIFSGGDPLILSNQKLREWLKFLDPFKNITMIRFHTRMPVIIPGRIDQGLLDLLHEMSDRFIFSMAIHFNHASIIDHNITQAITRLKKVPITLLSQSVLLRGVNDNFLALKNLFQSIHQLGLRPYYLHHPDRVKGAMHFYLPLKKGRQLYHQLHLKMPGWMIPQYIWDVPGGLGKVPAHNLEGFDFKGQALDRFGNIHSISEVDSSQFLN